MLSSLSLLIVEDDVLLRKQLRAALERLGADVTVAGSLETAREALRDLSFDFALVDVNLPDGLGTDLLQQKAFPAGTGVVVMTADGGVNGAVEAMRMGALDYLVKPFETAELPLVLARAKKAKQTARLTEHRRNDAGLAEFVFGEALASVEAQLRRILAADERLQTRLSPVLLIGETGTGKSSVARWIHQNGPRSSQAWVEVNCSALPENLAESELFGHEKGAFTDARSARMGLFEAAHGSTLFLDEIPSLSPPLQAKVLMAIEDQRIRRVGGNKSIPLDVRVIAASNRDLGELVATGQFREDLLHRLDLFRISLPPLRERGNDVLNMAEMLLEKLCRRHRLPQKRISEAGKHRLLGYGWPGNVRELSHELERAVVFSDEAEVAFEHLPSSKNASPPTSPESKGEWLNPSFVFPDQGFSLDRAIDQLVVKAVQQAGENVSAAARLLGVSRDIVRYRLAAIQSGKQSEPS